VPLGSYQPLDIADLHEELKSGVAAAKATSWEELQQRAKAAAATPPYTAQGRAGWMR